MDKLIASWFPSPALLIEHPRRHRLPLLSSEFDVLHVATAEFSHDRKAANPVEGVIWIPNGDFARVTGIIPSWLTPALRQLPACTTGRPGSPAGGISLPVQFLLRSRGLQEEDDAAIGPFSRQKGLPRCRDDLDQRHAAMSNTAPGPRAFGALWC